MIIREKDGVKSVGENPRGGTGRINGIKYLSGDEITNETKIVMANYLEVGSEIGEHQHVDDEEFYYIIEGTGEVLDDGKLEKVGPGDLVYTGSGHTHSLKNTGDTPLKFLAWMVNK